MLTPQDQDQGSEYEWEWIEPCPECDGAGFITWLEEPYDSIYDAIRSKRCEACRGSGEMQFSLTTKE